MLLKCAPIANC